MTDSTRRMTLPAPNDKRPILILQLLETTAEQVVKMWEFDEQMMVSVGRARDNDVVLSDVHVSRHHGEICFRKGAWEFVSIGRYGTLVAGQVVDRIALEDGAILQLGTSGPRLRFLQARPVGDTRARAVRTVSGPQFDLVNVDRSEDPRMLPFRKIQETAHKPRQRESSRFDETLF